MAMEAYFKWEELYELHHRYIQTRAPITYWLIELGHLISKLFPLLSQ